MRFNKLENLVLVGGANVLLRYTNSDVDKIHFNGIKFSLLNRILFFHFHFSGLRILLPIYAQFALLFYIYSTLRCYILLSFCYLKLFSSPNLSIRFVKDLMSLIAFNVITKLVSRKLKIKKSCMS